MLNLYANDGERLLQGTTWAAYVANGAIVVIVGMAYAISLFGVWALIGFAILLLMIPLQVRTLKAKIIKLKMNVNVNVNITEIC